MLDPEAIKIDDMYYTAALIEKTTWMVKRFTQQPQVDDQLYTEALITVPTQVKEVAIQAAIDRGSWA